MRLILLVSILLLSLSIKAQHKDLNKLYVKGKFEQILEKGMPKLQSSPDDAVLNMLVGRAHIALHNYEEAIPFLKKAYNNELAHLSVKSWSLAELGSAYYHIGQTKLGVESLKKAKEMRATRNCSRFAYRQLMRFQENDYFQKWDIQETEHMRFHFQDETVIENIENYKNKHEEAYQNINEFFKANLSKKIDLFVWKDREEAYDLFERRLGFANSERKIINVWYKQTKGHEICQILCDVAIKPIKKTKLINEGICEYFDQSIRNKMDVARKALPNGEFHLLELWESPTRYERGLSYPIGGAFIDFLINKEGKAKLMKFLKDQTIEHAEEIYPDFKDLVKIFEAMLEVRL
jgi:tetratricopeptide (TPR) repeat protein